MISGRRRKMRVNRLRAERRLYPCTCRIGIGHGLQSRKRFGANDKQRARRVDFLLQGASRHHRAEIRSTDTDVDDIRQAFTRVAAVAAVLYGLDKTFHLRQYAPDIAYTRHLKSHLVGHLGAQGHVQNRASFGYVDFLARKHGLNRRGHLGLTSELAQQFLGCRGDQVLGIVQVEVACLQREFFRARLVPTKQLAHISATHGIPVMRLKFLPGRQIYGVTTAEFAVRHFSANQSCNSQDTSRRSA